MAHNILLSTQSAKHYKSEFIFKLIDIMNNFPQLVSWTVNGQAVQFSQVTQIQSAVLPSYFRHSNFQSFLRQLHLYNFRQNKSLKNQLVFQHPIFKKGNQDQFHLIQRTKHKKEKQSLLKQLQNNDILKQITENPTLNLNQKTILSTLISFKLIVLEKHKHLKLKLNELTDSLKPNRSKTTKQNLLLLQEEIKLEIQANKKFSKSIDIFLTETLNERTQEHKQNSLKIHQHQPNPENIHIEKVPTSEPKTPNHSTPQFQKAPLFQSSNPFENNSEVFCQKNSFFPYHNIFSKPTNQILIKDSLIEKDCREQTEFRQIRSQQFDQNRIFMGELSESQDFMGCRNNPSIHMGLFNFQREPSLIFMPLPVYNRSVMSEFFDKPNKKIHADFGNNQKGDEKKDRQKVPSYKSKSQEFETSGQNGKGSGQHDENMANGNEDSEISFMNEECVN